MEQHQIILAIIAILAWSGFLLGHSHFSKYVSNPSTNIVINQNDPRSHRLLSSGRGVSSFNDPKSVTPRLAGPELSDSDSDSPIAVSDDNGELLKHLKQTEEIWLRGDYLKTFSSKRSPQHKIREEIISNTWGRGEEVAAAEAAAAEYFELRSAEATDATPLTVCDRPADFALLQNPNGECPKFTQATPILLLEGARSYGRTGNNIIELFHGIQFARENNVQIGIMVRSWAFHLIYEFWMHNTVDGWPDEGWKPHFENVLCMKVFENEEQLEGWDVIHKSTKELFRETSKLPLGEYMAIQLDILRSLFAHYNTGEGYDLNGKQTEDICSVINKIFGVEQRKSAIYTVIHYRYMTGRETRSGCDSTATLDLHPDYVKSILGPLGMMQHPIVFISDGHTPEVIERLLADPDIGGQIRVTDKPSPLEGDIALAIMANVFIGNPASTFSLFIAKARLALGFGHNELFRAKDNNGQWRTVCGDHCVFDHTITGAHS